MILFFCKNSDSIIHSAVIWLCVSVPSRIHGLASFCYTDKKCIFKKIGVVNRSISFKIFLWKSKKSIWNCRDPLQKNSNVLTVIISWMVCSRCRWRVVDVVGKTNLSQNKSEILWRWYWSSSFWPCSNRIFKQIIRTKASDLMHIFIGMSLFSTKPGLSFKQCLHCADHHAMNDARVNLWQCLVKRVIVDTFVNI